MKRRQFLEQMAFAGIAFPFSKRFLFESNHRYLTTPLKIGWITDVHHGYCADAEQRLATFIQQAEKAKPEFIIQGGDFCHPTAEAKSFINVWNQFKGPKYHVLGNHDMDKGNKQAIMNLWQMEQPYYSFDRGGFHFVILDCNYILKDGKYLPFEYANFYIDAKNRDLVNPEQIAWLADDLKQTKLQSIIVSHQAFDEIWTGNSVPNRQLIRQVIEEANREAGFMKVIACFCGHHHLDDHSIINNVHYFQINSASYYYVGDGFGSDGSKAMYADPLYCFVTIDPKGEIIIEGRSSQFMSPTPAEKKYPDAEKISASISDRKMGFALHV